MTKIIDLPTTASTDANTFVPVYKNGKTQKVSATALGGGGSGLDLTSTTDVATVDGTEYVPLNKPLGTVLRATVQRILDWMLARANTWTADQTINANLNFTGTGRRITGDFSTASIANRVMFQTTTPNGQTSVGVLPNGSSSISNINVFGGSDPANASLAQLVITGSDVALKSSATGSGAIIPLTFHAGNAERLRIDPTTGNVLATSGALGYGMGAGGSVVQATSKSTGVTLNKPTGEITMNNASLAAGASVMFSVDCSFFAVEDAVYAQQVGSNSYRIETYTASGAVFGIRVTNVTGGSLSDALKIRFVVWKGASA